MDAERSVNGGSVNGRVGCCGTGDWKALRRQGAGEKETTDVG